MKTFVPSRDNIHGAIIPEFILNTKITAGAKIMYAMLCDYSSYYKSDHCYPSHSALAKRLSCSVSSVKNYLSELVALKLISARRRQNSSSIYYMILPEALNGKESKTISEQTITDYAQPKVGYINTYNKQKANTSPPPLPPNPVSRSLPPASGPVGGGDFSAQDFEELCAAYPKKDAFGLARHACNQLRKLGLLPPLPVLLAAIERFSRRESWQRENGRYIPRLDNFLRGERWRDPFSPEEEQAAAHRLNTENLALAYKREQETEEARNKEKRERLQPIYDAFIAKFGEEARQHEGAEARTNGRWRFLHEKYGGLTASDVPDDITLGIHDFMTVYEQRRNAMAYHEARAAVDFHPDNQARKTVNRTELPLLARPFPTANPVCAAA